MSDLVKRARAKADEIAADVGDAEAEPLWAEIALLRELADALERAERALAEAREPITDTYACQKCGRRDGLDCVIPNHLWNEVEAETGCGVLCTWCLDAHLASKGIEVRALLAFIGKAISAGTDPRNDDAHWERHLGDLTGRCSEAIDRAERAERDRGALREAATPVAKAFRARIAAVVGSDDPAEHQRLIEQDPDHVVSIQMSVSGLVPLLAALQETPDAD